MKVLHVFKTYYPYTKGGIEKVIHEIIIGARDRGVTSDVFTFGDKTEVVQSDGYKVFFQKRLVEIASTPISLTAFFAFKKIAKDYDIIHYHFPYPFADLLHFFCRLKKPSIVTYHSDIVKQKFLLKLYEPLAKRFLKSMDKIIATSPNYVKTSKLLEKVSDNIEIIPLGIDDTMYQVNHDLEAKWRLKFPENGFFLFIGVLRYYKGLHVLIEAAKDANYPIVILGAGAIEDELKKQAKSRSVSNVHFVGALKDEDKTALLKLCHGVVFPSHLRSEAFGLSLVEGAIFSKPLISSEIGTGTTYINIDNETGIVVPPGDSKALREAMDYLWENKNEANRMGLAAYKRYKMLFTADKMVAAYAKQYKQVLRSK